MVDGSQEEECRLKYDCYDRDGNQVQGNKKDVGYRLFKGEVREEEIPIKSNVVSYEIRLK